MKRRSSNSKVKERDKGKSEEEGDAGAGMEVLYAIRDAKNTHGGGRVGTWKEVGASLASIPERFKTQFAFSEKDQKMMEQELER